MSLEGHTISSAHHSRGGHYPTDRALNQTSHFMTRPIVGAPGTVRAIAKSLEQLFAGLNPTNIPLVGGITMLRLRFSSLHLASSYVISSFLFGRVPRYYMIPPADGHHTPLHSPSPPPPLLLSLLLDEIVRGFSSRSIWIHIDWIDSHGLHYGPAFWMLPAQLLAPSLKGSVAFWILSSRRTPSC